MCQCYYLSYYGKISLVIIMRLLVISDVHGDYDSLDMVVRNETFDRLIVLGDLLPYSYNYEDDLEDKIMNLLSKYKNKLVLIKGNCDSFINFESYGLYPHDVISLTFNNHIVTFTHGHLYNKGFLPNYHGDLFMSGHTHVPLLIKEQGIVYANPGSIGKPRNSSSKGYLIFDNNIITLKTINKDIIKELYLS